MTTEAHYYARPRERYLRELLHRLRLRARLAALSADPGQVINAMPEYREMRNDSGNPLQQTFEDDHVVQPAYGEGPAHGLSGQLVQSASADPVSEDDAAAQPTSEHALAVEHEQPAEHQTAVGTQDPLEDPEDRAAAPTVTAPPHAQRDDGHAQEKAPEPERRGRGHAGQQPPDRVSILWRAKWWILAAVVIVTGATYGLSTLIPATYSAEAKVVISAVAPTGLTKDAVDATNELAPQYAQLVKGTQVIVPAARSLGLSTSTLSSSISSGTVAAQNIVAINASADDARAAQTRANVVARRFVTVQQQRNARIAREYLGVLAAGNSRRTGALSQALSQALSELGSRSPAVRATASNNLSLLLTERQQFALASAQANANSQPSLSIYQLAGPGSKVIPKPVLYAALALVVSFVLAAQLAAFIGVRRGRRSAGAV